MRRSRGILIALIALPLAACEWFSTMSDPPSIEPHERAPLLAAEHTVPLDGLPDFDLTNADERVSNPQPSSPASLEMGRAYYDTFCAVCHGATGLGNGPLSKRFPAIPAIATGQVAGYTDPYVFALISKGRGLMPEYSRIPVSARWDIVNYVRTLSPGAGATGAGGTAEAGATGTVPVDASAQGGTR
ncbi:MAG TPA: cytochrome c [Gemmatimonadota bacterium]|nr:cytochrome c [Gemmatimonadota bacterium]